MTSGYRRDLDLGAILTDLKSRTAPGLDNINAGGEGISQFLNMSDNQYLLKVILNRVNGFLELLNSGSILGTEAFINDQGG